MRCACVDIGTNTTRVLVAEAREGGLSKVIHERAFTRLGTGGAIPRAKIAELTRVVARHVELAERLGASRLKVVATHAIRDAANRDDLVAAIEAACGRPVTILDGDQEARLAFAGATRTLGGRTLQGRVAVVDVGGGSTEIAIGTLERGVYATASIGVGSGALTDRHVRSDPPTSEELQAAGQEAAAAFQGLVLPAVDAAVAVGGGGASTRRLVGPVLDDATGEQALRTLAGAPAAALARRFTIDPARVRLLPAGLVILGTAAKTLGQPLRIGEGGVREGVVLELARTI
jgi:exopolyphosphatase / guanosine-5'-triphosphate,3'-diphosphate pyrophosphatase